MNKLDRDGPSAIAKRYHSDRHHPDGSALSPTHGYLSTGGASSHVVVGAKRKRRALGATYSASSGALGGVSLTCTPPRFFS